MGSLACCKRIIALPAWGKYRDSQVSHCGGTHGTLRRGEDQVSGWQSGVVSSFTTLGTCGNDGDADVCLYLTWGNDKRGIGTPGW